MHELNYDLKLCTYSFEIEDIFNFDEVNQTVRQVNGKFLLNQCQNESIKGYKRQTSIPRRSNIEQSPTNLF